jgi:H+-translocating NAD(P) transhydrogenase subunit alpha
MSLASKFAGNAANSMPPDPSLLPRAEREEAAAAVKASPLPSVGEGQGEGVLDPLRRAGRLALALLAALLINLDPAFAASEGSHGVSPFLFEFSIFVLAIFVGYYVVWSVTPALHTPLMSVTNAISSVIVVGALLAVAVEAAEALSSSGSTLAKIFGFLALVMASVNIFGGFLVTSRMLAMYKKKDKKAERP